MDKTLDAWKQQYLQLSDILLMEKHALMKEKAIQKICKGHEMNVIYVPNMGFLTSLDAAVDISTLPWQFQFTMQDGNACYKTPRMFALDEHYGDILLIIVDREVEILQNLVETCQEKKQSLLSLFELLTDLDAFLFSCFLTTLAIFAQAAQKEC